MQSERNYWTQRRFQRRTLIVGGAGAAGLAVVGCSSSNNKPKSAATAPATAGTGAAGSGTPVAPGAAGTARAGGSPAAVRAAPARDVKSMSEKEFFASLPENPPRDWSDADVKKGGTLTALVSQGLPSMDWITIGGGVSIVGLATTPMHNRLIRLPAGQGMKSVVLPQIEPDLAGTWERPDASTFTFKLRPNIKWQNSAPLNGRAMTIDDIKYSFNRGKTFEKSQYKDHFAFFDKVEAAASDSVRVTLARPHPAADLLLGTWFTQIMSPELGDKPDLAASNPVGTGAFIFDHNTPNVEIAYRRNPDYFKTDAQGRNLPYLDGLRVSYVADPATEQAQWDTGKGDIYHSVYAPPSIMLDNIKSYIEGHPNQVLQLFLGPTTPILAIGHMNKPPWNDVRVRQAVNMTVDRQKIIDALYHGVAVNGLDFPWPSITDHAPSLDEMGQYYKYDPQAAKQLLAAAGFANGIELEVLWPPFYAFEDMGPLWQQQAQIAGVKLTLQKSVDLASHVNALIKRSWKDLALDGRAIDYIDPMATIPRKLAGSPANYLDLDDPKMADYFQKQQNQLGDERKATLKEVWQYQKDQVFEVPMPSRGRLWVMQPWLKNFVETAYSAGAGYGYGQMEAVWFKK